MFQILIVESKLPSCNTANTITESLWPINVSTNWLLLSGSYPIANFQVFQLIFRH
jgi:hypothetical protein